MQSGRTIFLDGRNKNPHLVPANYTNPQAASGFLEPNYADFSLSDEIPRRRTNGRSLRRRPELSGDRDGVQRGCGVRAGRFVVAVADGRNLLREWLELVVVWLLLIGRVFDPRYRHWVGHSFHVSRVGGRFPYGHAGILGVLHWSGAVARRCRNAPQSFVDRLLTWPPRRMGPPTNVPLND